MITLCWHTPRNYMDTDGCYVAFFCWKWYPERGRMEVTGPSFLKSHFCYTSANSLATVWASVHPLGTTKTWLCRKSFFLAEDHQTGGHSQAPLWLHTPGKGVSAGRWGVVAAPAACAGRGCACSFVLNGPNGLVKLMSTLCWDKVPAEGLVKTFERSFKSTGDKSYTYTF